jgi:hypothetical protein
MLSEKKTTLFGRAGVFALVGAILTLIYDLGTTVAFGFSAMAESIGIAALVAAGLPFTGIHVAANAGAFAIVATGISRQRFALALLAIVLIVVAPCEVLADDGHESTTSDSVRIPDSLHVAAPPREADIPEVRFWQGPHLDSKRLGRAEGKLSWPNVNGSESLGDRMSSFTHVTPGIFGTVHPVLASYFGFPTDVCLDGRVVAEEQVPLLALIESWRTGELSDLLYSSGFDLGRIESVEIITSPFGSVASAAFSSGNSVLGATWAAPIDPPYSQFLLSQGQEKYSATHFRFGRSLPLDSWVTARAVWMDEGRFREGVSAARSGFAAAAGALLTKDWEVALLAKRSESHGDLISTIDDTSGGHHYEETRKDIDLVLARSGSKVLGEVRFFHGDYQSLLRESDNRLLSQWRQVYGVQCRTGYATEKMFAEAGTRNIIRHGLEGYETGWWTEQDWYLRARLGSTTNQASAILRYRDGFPDGLSGSAAFKRSLSERSTAALSIERLVWEPDPAVEQYAEQVDLEVDLWKVTTASGSFEFRSEELTLVARQSFVFQSDKPGVTSDPQGWMTGVRAEALPWRFFKFWGLVEARGGEEGALLSYEHKLRSVIASSLLYDLPRGIQSEFFARWDRWVDDLGSQHVTGAGIVFSSEGVTLSFKARNLFDEDAEWIRGFPLEGRQLLITLDWYFVD